jgi:hypothetical protein
MDKSWFIADIISVGYKTCTCPNDTKIVEKTKSTEKVKNLNILAPINLVYVLNYLQDKKIFYKYIKKAPKNSGLIYKYVPVTF